jgi:predicted amidohydrolase
MKIALAQIKPVIGNIEANIQQHIKWITDAVEQDAQAIFFPELSITGYEPLMAKALAMNTDDPRLHVFETLSSSQNIYIGIGMPVKQPTGTAIGMLVFQPDKIRQIYLKQFLHEDELPYFIAGNTALIIHVANTLIAPAICYESLLTQHAEKARQMGCTIYLASVAKSIAGIEKGIIHYPTIARQLGMTVCMVNSIGPCDNFVAAGHSAIWNAMGLLEKQLGGQTEALLINTFNEK